MTQNLKSPTSSSPATSHSPAGNHTAASAAKRAKTALENIFEAPLERVKIRDLPTREAKLNAVADLIEQAAFVKEGLGFNMGPYYAEKDTMENYGYRDQTGHSCGSVACIAGWTVYSDDPNDAKSISSGVNFAIRARDILGLTDNECGELFTRGGRSIYSLAGTTDKHAVAVLRDFAATGAVHWDHFNSEGKKIK